MSGHVEVDETYVGGKVKNMHKHRQENAKRLAGGRARWPSWGLLERHGNGCTVRTKIVRGTKRKELYGIIREHVEEQSHIDTDALPSYASMNSRVVHQGIDHTGAYVRGQVHTNGLESFWSLLKRAIKGTYAAVDPVHLFRYVDEQAFRFNKRKDNDAGRFSDALNSVTGRRITYKELVCAQPA